MASLGLCCFVRRRKLRMPQAVDWLASEASGVCRPMRKHQKNKTDAELTCLQLILSVSVCEIKNSFSKVRFTVPWNLKPVPTLLVYFSTRGSTESLCHNDKGIIFACHQIPPKKRAPKTSHCTFQFVTATVSLWSPVSQKSYSPFWRDSRY